MLNTKFNRRLLGAVAAASLIGFAGIADINLGFSVVGIAQAAPGDVEPGLSVALQPDKLPMRGNPNALITIVEFSDYECPFCNRVEPTLNQLLRDYPDDLRIVFAHHPLPFHKNAMAAAKAAHAAYKQGKFWEMHERLFENQKNLREEFYIETAKELGLDIEQFKADMNSSETESYIKKCMTDASSHGISGTPSFLINGVQFVGAQPSDNFKKKIDEELARAKTMKNAKNLSGDALYKELVKTAPQPAPKAAADDDDTTERVYIEDDKAPVLGSAKAPVTIVEYTDFQCPFCQRANKTLHELIKNNPNKIRVVFKHYPLSFHKDAELAHRAAEAAKKQGKFWEYHDLLFENREALDRDSLIKYAKQLKLNEKKFIEYMDGPESLGIVKQDIESGTKNGVRGTPHFFFNGKHFSGAQPLTKFQDTLDAELRIADGYKKKKLTGQKLYAQIVKDNPASQKPTNVGDDSAPSGPRKLASENYAPTRGSAKAPITLVVFEDYECPFSKRANDTIKELVKNNPNKIRVVFKHYPLDFHSHAKLAHKAAAAAHKQGKFLEYRDLLFENQKNLEREDLIEYAKKLKLNEKKFIEYMDGPEAMGLLQMNIDEGKKLDVSGTPNFFFNGRKITGALPVESFQNVVNQELKFTEKFAKKKLTGRKLYEQIVKDNVGIDDYKEVVPEKPSILGMPYKGASDAPVTIIEYSDFQCPFCKRASRTIDELLKLPEYQGKIKVVFKQLPLEFHENAHRAAEAAMFAHDKGMVANDRDKFWQMHDIMFENSSDLSEDDLLDYAEKIGLSRSELKAALDSEKFKEIVDEQAREANRLGLKGTPSFLINGEQLLGAQPIEKFKEKIDAALEKAKK